VYDESKRRPLYVLREMINVPRARRDVPRALQLDAFDDMPREKDHPGTAGGGQGA